LVTKNNRNNLDSIAQGKLFPSIREFSGMIFTFFLTLIAWIFFRAENVSHAIQYLSGIFSSSLFEKPVFENSDSAPVIVFLVLLFIIIEWLGREKHHPLEHLEIILPKIFRWVIYLILLFAVATFFGTETNFIYFQF
jgi:Na+/H+-dicarboxylate symporter